MQGSAYEDAIIGSMPKPSRPPQPSVIAMAIAAIGGRDHYHHNWQGHWIWRNVRLAYERRQLEGTGPSAVLLKERGEPQIDVNPAWRV